MEATGSYYYGFARCCFENEMTVHVVNPWQIKSFSDARLSRVKTDRVDARLIAEFGRVMAGQLWPWRPMPDSLVAITGLVRLGDGLLQQRIAAENRTHALSVADSVLNVEADHMRSILAAERDRLMQSAGEVADSCATVGPWLEALQRLPGVGRISGLKILAYSGDMRRFAGARQYAAFTGLPPKVAESGVSLRSSRMSRRGSRQLRSVFYWAALSASRSKSQQGDFYRALVDRGKKPKVAMVALANRLARAAWACVAGADAS